MILLLWVRRPRSARPFAFHESLAGTRSAGPAFECLRLSDLEVQGTTGSPIYVDDSFVVVTGNESLVGTKFAGPAFDANTPR